MMIVGNVQHNKSFLYCTHVDMNSAAADDMELMVIMIMIVIVVEADMMSYD